MNNKQISYASQEGFANSFFYLFLILHTVLWTAGPALTRFSLPHDTLESISWGLQWQWGYNKHPFLAAWLTAGIVKLLQSVDWPVYFLAQLSISLTFFTSWRMALKFLPPVHAIIAALLLDGITFYNINSFNFTPDTLQLPLWILCSLFVYRSFDKNKIMDWLFLGLFAALSILCKYQSALILVSIFAFSLINNKARAAYKKPGIYLAMLCFFLLLLPHLIWLYHNEFITIEYALAGGVSEGESHYQIVHAFQFILSCFVSVLGLFILLWPFYKAEKISLKLSQLQNSFLVFVGLGPIILTLMLAFISGAHFPARWATPYFSFLGIISLVLIKPKIDNNNLKRFFISLVILSLSLWTVRMSTLTVLQRNKSDAWLPNAEIARTLEQLWSKKSLKPLSYLAGSHYLVANTLPYMQKNPIPFFNWSLKESPWVNLSDFKQKGGLFIWDLDKNYDWDKSKETLLFDSSELKQTYPSLELIGIYHFYTHGKKKRAISIAIARLPAK
jgi:4-amino-4-deoxy-L-arabinose transferase-like glycosyltransferase